MYSSLAGRPAVNPAGTDLTYDEVPNCWGAVQISPVVSSSRAWRGRDRPTAGGSRERRVAYGRIARARRGKDASGGGWGGGEGRHVNSQIA